MANHLNDIAKDHPQLIVQWLHEHLPDAPPQRRALLKHACRTLIKQGHPQVLKAWGLGAPLRGEATLALSPKRLAVGESLQLTVQLHSTAARAQTLLIDYAVHHVKASGETTPKVFKGWTLQLGAHEQLSAAQAPFDARGDDAPLPPRPARGGPAHQRPGARPRLLRAQRLRRCGPVGGVEADGDAAVRPLHHRALDDAGLRQHQRARAGGVVHRVALRFVELAPGACPGG